MGAIAVGLIPQYKVNKGKILCAEFGVKDAQLKEAKTSDYKEAIQQKIDAGKKVSNFAKTDFIEEYCISLWAIDLPALT